MGDDFLYVRYYIDVGRMERRTGFGFCLSLWRIFIFVLYGFFFILKIMMLEGNLIF